MSKQYTKNIPALVIGVDVSALNVIRSLGRKGVDVYAMGSQPREYGAVSRYANFVLCDDLNDEEKVIFRLTETSKNLRKKMVLLCTSDLHVLYVSRNRDLLSPFFEFVLPEHDIIQTLMDKERFYEFAYNHNFALPETFFSKTRAEFQTICQTISYPCVVKPLYRTRYWSENVPPEKKVIRMDSVQHMIKQLEEFGAFDQELILQEWIPGDDTYVYFCLAYINREGRALATLCGRKLRQYPSITGVTSLAETVKNVELTEMTLKVLSAAGCKGLCSVEYKRHAIDGSFRIIEPTVGRVDLQEGISTQAGLDIPFLAYQDALGIAETHMKNYKSGLKWINEPFEFNSFITRSRQHGIGVREFLLPYRGPRSYALLSVEDPLPFLFFLIWTGKRGLRYLRSLFYSKTKNVKTSDANY
jgi:D-aspartate ligase